MLHQKGNRVDVEALRDQIRLRQGAGKGPKMGSHGYRSLRRWKSGFSAPLEVFGVYENTKEEDLGQGVTEGPTSLGEHPTPWARPPPLCLPRGSSDLISKSPGLLLVQERTS